jgi:pseudouridylate synthase
MPTPARPTLSTARVALETTLLVHGVPRASAVPLARKLADIVRSRGSVPLLVGVVAGRPRVGLSDAELDALLADAGGVVKLSTANLGVALHRGLHGATTVSTTMELAAGAGVSVFATGGIGGVHPFHAGAQSPLHLDISSDLVAFTRWPVAVVTSGCKSILDLAATRELLETLGVTVVGFRTDRFPAFYLREDPDGRAGKLDARFDDAADLAAFVRTELARHPRGIVVCNPIPPEHELRPDDWRRWLGEAQRRAAGAHGRDTTPALLAALHEVSGGATLGANLALVESNAALAADLAWEMARPRGNDLP